VTPRDSAAADRPHLPAEVEEVFLRRRGSIPSGASLVYRPALLASSRLHYVDRRADVDHWEELWWMAPLREDLLRNPWEGGFELEERPELEAELDPDAKFGALPSEAAQARRYASWGKRLATHLYRERTLTLECCPSLKLYSRPGQSAGEFQASLTQAVRERRDLEIEKLRKRYSPKLARLQDRIHRAEQRLGREVDQRKTQKLQTAVSLGATVLGALFGRRAASVGTVGRATTTIRGMARVAREQEDIARARESLENLQEKLEALETEFEEATEDLRERLDPSAVVVEERAVRPRKSDIEVDRPVLVWTPWTVSSDGIAERAF
jgi:hypothetical protein